MKDIFISLLNLLKKLSSAYLIQIAVAAPVLAFVFLLSPPASSADDVATATLILFMSTYVVLLMLSRLVASFTASAPSRPAKTGRRIFLISLIVECVLSASALVSFICLRWIMPIPWAAALMLKTSAVLAIVFGESVMFLIIYVIIHNSPTLDLSPLVKGIRRGTLSIGRGTTGMDWTSNGTDAVRAFIRFKRKLAA